MTNSLNKPTPTFWVIGVAALFWNIMGVAAYIGQAYMTDEILSALPEADQLYYTNVPAWVTAAFAIAVFAGFVGCIALLIRKKWAVTLFIISLLTVLVQFVYNFFIQDYMELSPSKAIMPIVVIGIAVFLIWYSKKCQEKGWI
ncbi:hypothetical protein [uncultured Lutibacter sp.]|uniref:hypothetical protein n=1 Tax=uncultured Lutibacter sp. TaxID=437739 RepID=UPI002606BB11|nr:hypothetical protein [uncultured Lutibacter sp.]